MCDEVGGVLLCVICGFHCETNVRVLRWSMAKVFTGGGLIQVPPGNTSTPANTSTPGFFDLN